jgi:hypothetical protein
MYEITEWIVKINLSLCLIKHHVTKNYEGMEV